MRASGLPQPSQNFASVSLALPQCGQMTASPLSSSRRARATERRAGCASSAASFKTGTVSSLTYFVTSRPVPVAQAGRAHADHWEPNKAQKEEDGRPAASCECGKKADEPGRRQCGADGSQDDPEPFQPLLFLFVVLFVAHCLIRAEWRAFSFPARRWRCCRRRSPSVH